MTKVNIDISQVQSLVGTVMTMHCVTKSIATYTWQLSLWVEFFSIPNLAFWAIFATLLWSRKSVAKSWD